MFIYISTNPQSQILETKTYSADRIGFSLEG